MCRRIDMGMRIVWIVLLLLSCISCGQFTNQTHGSAAAIPIQSSPDLSAFVPDGWGVGKTLAQIEADIVYLQNQSDLYDQMMAIGTFRGNHRQMREVKQKLTALKQGLAAWYAANP